MLTCIVLSGVSAGKMCNMSVDSVYITLDDETIKYVRQLVEVNSLRKAGKMAVKWASETYNVNGSGSGGGGENKKNKNYFPKLEYLIKYVQLKQHKASSHSPTSFNISVDNE